MIFNMSGGGGAALNFKVMGGTSAPSNPKENTIWVNTNNLITGWQFSSTYKSKNLLRITLTNQTYLGVNLTVNTDGSITAIGTPTNDMFLDFGKVSLKKQTGYALVLPEPTGGNAAIYVNSNNVINGSWNYGGGKTIFSLSEDGETGIALYMKSGVAHNLRLYPMVTLASETDYTHVPYGGAKNGAVWIQTGTSSTAPFNALKKNGITVYPMSAKQYVNGAWVNKPIKVYQSGSWKDALLYTVVPNTGITWSKEKNVTVTQNADSTVFSHGAGDDTVHYADFSVDLTPYTKLKIVGNVSASAWSDSNSVKISIGAFSTNASFVTGFTQDIYNRDGTININNTYDISSLSGIYLIRYNACRNNDADSSHTCKFIATSIELS